jgi:hypothetical protein
MHGHGVDASAAEAQGVLARWAGDLDHVHPVAMGMCEELVILVLPFLGVGVVDEHERNPLEAHALDESGGVGAQSFKVGRIMF